MNVSLLFLNFADLYALSRYFDANSKASKLESEDVRSSGSQQIEDKHIETKLDESEIRLAQLQHHLPSNEPGALMHLIGDAERNDEEDTDTRECRNFFKNKKFFLSREVGIIIVLIFCILCFLVHLYPALKVNI